MTPEKHPDSSNKDTSNSIPPNWIDKFIENIEKNPVVDPRIKKYILHVLMTSK